jgi:hypothetical protein
MPALTKQKTEHDLQTEELRSLLGDVKKLLKRYDAGAAVKSDSGNPA